jgi:hypothetical protein
MSMQPSDALDPVFTPQPLNTTVPGTDLDDLVGALQRELAVPGEFATVFPNTQNSDLAASLGDAFAQAQLDGFFSQQTLDLNTLIVTPGLSSGGMALVVIYAAIRTIKAQLRNLQSSVTYKAGPAEYQATYSSNVLTTELKDFQERRQELLALVLRQGRSVNAAYVADGYLIRAFSYFPYYYGEVGSFYPFELAGTGLGLGI